MVDVFAAQSLFVAADGMAAAGGASADSASEDGAEAAGVTNVVDIANDDDIDENLFDGEDLDIVEEQLDTLGLVD